MQGKKEPQPPAGPVPKEFTALPEASPRGSVGLQWVVTCYSLQPPPTTVPSLVIFTSLVASLPPLNSHRLCPHSAVITFIFRGTTKPPSSLILPQVSLVALVPGLSPRSRVALGWVPATVKASAFPSWSWEASWAAACLLGTTRGKHQCPDKQERVFVTRSGVWPLAAQKPDREARLVEEEMDASRRGSGGGTCPKADFPSPTTLHQQSGGKSFYRRERAPGRNSKVSSDAHLQLVFSSLTSGHLGCLSIVNTSVPGLSLSL